MKGRILKSTMIFKFNVIHFYFPVRRADCVQCGSPLGSGRGMSHRDSDYVGQSTLPLCIMFGSRIVDLAITGWESVKMLIFVDRADVIIPRSWDGCRE